MDRIFDGSLSDGAGDAGHGLLGQSLSDMVKPLREKLRGEVRHWVAGRIDDPLERLSGARQSVAWLEQHFQAVESAATQLGQSTVEKIRELRHTADQGPQVKPQDVHQPVDMPLAERLSHYFRLRLDQLAFLAAGEMTRKMLSDLKALSDEFTAFGREIGQIASALAEDAPAASEPEEADAAKAPPAVRVLRSQLPDLAAVVDGRLLEEFLRPHGGLLETVMLGGRPRAQLVELLQEIARQAVQDALSKVDILAAALSDGEEGSAGDLPLRSGLALAMPPSLQFGGARRVLAVLPKEADTKIETSQLSQALATEVSRASGYDNSLLLCVEAERLSLPHVALDLVENRRDCTEFAHRVRTRTDIRWTPLFVPPTESDDTTSANLAALPPLSDPLIQETQMISIGSQARADAPTRDG